VLAREDTARAQVHVEAVFAVPSELARDYAVREVAQRVIEQRIGALREELAATYSVGVVYTHSPAGDLLSIATDVDAARAGEVIARLDAELARLADPAGDLRADFVRARRAAVAAALVRTGSTDEAADQLEAIAALDLPSDFYAQAAARIGAVTPAQVAALLHGDLVRAHRVVLVAGPNAKAIADAAHLGAVTELARVKK
jgi:predicted Zn-dependent peptidase